MSTGHVCRGCGQKILWAYTEKGNRMPLDPDPIPEPVTGAYVVTGNKCRKAEPMFDPPGTIYWMNHWASCSTPDSFRERKR